MRLDWTKVPGYSEDMKPEEKLALLDGFEFETAETAGKTISKDLYDKLATEHAATKKALKERMSDDERKEAERTANETALREELEQLKKERAESGFKARLLEAKYSAEDAAKLAKSAAEGDMTAFFDALAKANVATEKAIRAEIMKATPRPDGGDTPKQEDAAEALAVKVAKGMAETAKAPTNVLSHYIKTE